jgi:hypothetical protein
MPTLKLTPRQAKAWLKKPARKPPSPASLRKTAARRLEKMKRVQAWQHEMQLRPGYFIPVQTVSEANAREDWRAKMKRTAREREAGYIATLAYNARWKTPIGGNPAMVHLTRYSPSAKKMDEFENVRVALKHIVDGIADALGIDDADMEWYPHQEKSPPGCHGVLVKFE